MAVAIGVVAIRVAIGGASEIEVLCETNVLPPPSLPREHRNWPLSNLIIDFRNKHNDD
jgi:hypothetical protein